MTDRGELLKRLHEHSDDFDATRKLANLDAAAEPRDSRASERLIRDGSSCMSRIRGWRPTRTNPKAG